MVFYNKYKIRKTRGNIETHEVFLDKLAKIKEEELGISEKKFEVPVSEKIVYALFFIFFMLAGALFLKTFYLQAILGKELYNLSENNKGSIALIRPERGIIYDKNLKKLVSNSPAFDLLCDKRKLSEDPIEATAEIENIAKATGKNLEELKKEFESSEEPGVLVSENILEEPLLVLETKINGLKSCKIEKNVVRDYLFVASFSHLLGYTGRINQNELSSSKKYAVNDYIGKTGIEKSYENILRGTPGQLEAIKNAVGISKGNKIVLEPKSGENLVLYLDSDLQTTLYNALEKSIKNIGSKRGAAVAMDPKTGGILAMVSYPSYDNNLFSKGISKTDFDKIQNDLNQPLFDRAIAAQYPTGSTIKPFEASGALQEKIISPDKKINDPGYILIHSQYDPNIVYKFSGVKPHGLVNMREAIAVSSNIYFYTIGGGFNGQQGLGPARIKKYLSLFGWGEKTGIDLPGEFSGFIPTPEWKKQTKKQPWWDGDTYNLSIGQSDLMVTPLQVATAYCSIANDGTLYKPQIVQKIVDSSKSIIKEFKPEITRQNFIDSENLQIIREGMRDAVQKSYGSSYYLNDLPVAVASKTGTAETSRAGHFNTWTSAFAPYENPQIVLVVTIEDVQGLRSATLPVAHEVLKWYFSKK
ncbi:MAG: penicillin-binding protein 2 [Patescibacteria group bacterium]